MQEKIAFHQTQLSEHIVIMLGKKKYSEKFNVNILGILSITYFSSGKLAWHVGGAN